MRSFLFASSALLIASAAEAGRVPLGDLDGVAEICQLAADGSCAPRAVVPARIDGERARAVWEAPAGSDLSASYRARLSALRAPLASSDFAFRPREDEARIRFDLDLESVWVLGRSGGSAEVGRGGAAIVIGDGAASLVLHGGALASRQHLTAAPDGGAAAFAGQVSGAFLFGPSTTALAAPAIVTIAYDPARIPFGNPETAVQLYQLSGGAFAPVPGSAVDTTLRTVSAPASSLGTFAAGVPVTIQQVVGAGGATVHAPGGVTLTVPAFALDSSQAITVTETTDAAPSGTQQLSPVYRMGPDGLVFARPITVAIPFHGDPTHARLYWTKFGSPTEYQNLGGKVVGSTLYAKVTHFSSGFVGVGPAVRDVTGVKVDTWLTETTTTNIPDDLSFPGRVEALIPDGSGGFTTIPGVGTASGTFEIPGVPDGPYYLRTLFRSYYQTETSAPDLGGYQLGRPDVTPADDSQLPFTLTSFNVGNLSPWQPGDFLEFFSFSANAFLFGVQDFTGIGGGPNPGDTALSNITVTELAFGAGGSTNLIDGTRGDTAVLTQLSTRPGLINGQPTGPLYQSVSRIYQPAPFTQVDGTTTSIGNFPTNPADVFTDVSQANGLSVDIRTTQFAPALASLNPAFTSSSTTCDPFNHPGATPHVTFDIQLAPATGVAPGTSLSQFSSLPDLLFINADVNGPDLQSGTMFYGTPLTGTFNVFGTVDVSCQIRFKAPGATTGVSILVDYRQDMAIGPLTAAPIVPVLSAAQNIKVNGLDFFSEQTGIGASPTLSWSAPATGAPVAYLVSIYNLWVDRFGHTRRSGPEAFLQTRGTSITLPNLLTPDPRRGPQQSFVFQLTAISNANPDLADAPLRGVLPDASAAALSAMMTP